MRITRVLIENFRSIKRLEFYPTDICVLVGENNAGKTNILAALNLLLGETWPSRRVLEAFDYYNHDTSEAIHIEVEFAENEHNIHSVWCTIPWDGQGEVKAVYRSTWGGLSQYNLSTKTREQCALVYLDANRHLDYHLGSSRWTLFGRIIRQLDAHFQAHVTPEQKQGLIDCFNQARKLLKTGLYSEFEETFKAAFRDQLKRTTHTIELDFCTFDPLSYYRSIQPLLREDGRSKSPSEAGQGMRNLILVALFRTYATVFKGQAMISIEEPETYLHPHAQRSLATLFDELARAGSQIFYPTHSASFIQIEHFDRVCLVEKRCDSSGELSTQVRQVAAHELLDTRQRLYPHMPMSESGLRERYRNICDLEHNEAFFARKIVLVEGETEEYAFPIYAKALGDDYDADGISVVNAHGKHNLDQFYQLYTAFGIPVYLIFDNDRGGQSSDLAHNEVLLRMLGQPASKEPAAVVADTFAIVDRNFEETVKSALDAIEAGKYQTLNQEAAEQLGGKAGRGLVARFMAKRLVQEHCTPTFIAEIAEAIRPLGANPDQHSRPLGSLPQDEGPLMETMKVHDVRELVAAIARIGKHTKLSSQQVCRWRP